jgi:hypothetical protein
MRAGVRTIRPWSPRRWCDRCVLPTDIRRGWGHSASTRKASCDPSSSRSPAQEIAALRAAPVAHRVVGGDVYRLSVPEIFTGSGARTIPQESRRVQTWGGYLCGDADTVVAVNVTPLDVRSLADSLQRERSPYS